LSTNRLAAGVGHLTEQIGAPAPPQRRPHRVDRVHQRQQVSLGETTQEVPRVVVGSGNSLAPSPFIVLLDRTFMAASFDGTWSISSAAPTRSWLDRDASGTSSR
jgi:hypothetical protein